jgi:integrase
MGRGKQVVTLTTITPAKASEFLRGADVRDVLACRSLTGFHLLKLSTGGVWRYRYTDAAGKRRVATVGKYSNFKPQAAADIVHQWIVQGIDPLAEKSSRKARAREEVRDAQRRTLRHYLDNYYRPHMERSWKLANAKATYGRIARHFAKLLDRDMATLDKADIDEWQREVERRGRAYSTVRRTFGALQTLLNRAVRDRAIETNPLANHRLLEPTLRDQGATTANTHQAERRMLTDGEIQAIHKGLDLFADEIRQQRRNSRAHGKPDLPDLDKVTHPHWFIPFCLLALHTGLRPGDIYSLNWRELNLPFSRLTKLCEKTAHAARRERKPAVVDMKLNTTIRAVMTAWHKDTGQPADGLVFPSPKTGRQLDKTAHKKPWAHVKMLGGLPKELHFYALRHHFISALLAAGVPIFTVARLAGHRSAEMILQSYGHLCPDQASEALDIVAKSIAGPAESPRTSTSPPPEKNSPLGG